MSARDMTAGVNHHHQSRPDRQWRDHSRASADYRAANCENQEECPYEFGNIFVHKPFLSRHRLKKASQFGNWTLVLVAMGNAGYARRRKDAGEARLPLAD